MSLYRGLGSPPSVSASLCQHKGGGSPCYQVPVVIAGHTTLVAIQIMQVDENGGWVNLKVHNHDYFKEPNT